MERNASSRVSYRSGRYRQILWSTPHYLAELRALRKPNELYAWLQFKLPYSFPTPAFPPRVNLELTNHCNLKCRHCHRSVMNRQIGSMDYALLQKIVTEIARHKSCVLKIVGLGEPSLYEHCDAFMRSLKDLGVKSVFYTNGLLLERFEHEQVLDWQIPHIVISIDGIDRRSYEYLRVGGNYDRLKTAVESFQRKREQLGHTKPMIEVRHVIVPEESPLELAEFKKTWMETADTVMFNHIIPSGPVEASSERSARRCRDIRRELYIRWNGMVPVCGYQYLVDKQEWLADLHDMTLQEAWNHSSLKGRRSLHMQGSRAVPNFCAVCSQTI